MSCPPAGPPAAPLAATDPVISTSTSTAWIALGANLGDRAATLAAAVRDLARLGRVVAVSPWIETEAWGYAGAPPFLNGALRLDTRLAPAELLRGLLAIEASHGRERAAPNAPRTLDLDLLFYDDRVIDTPELIVPHPRLHERGFVLDPLVTIGPDVVHPVLGLSVRALRDTLNDAAGEPADDDQTRPLAASATECS